jgi:hypothetical protein
MTQEENELNLSEKQQEKSKLADRLKHKIFFADADQDFMFQLFLSYHQRGGSAIGELFNVARRINPTDPMSWKEEFMKEGSKVEAWGEASLRDAHQVSARESFLRAYTYYRSAFCASYPGEKDFESIYRKSAACFKKSMDLQSFPVEWVEFEYEGFKFPCCFLKPDNSGKKRPAIIVHNGGESHMEDHYFLVGKAGIDRGYNMLLWDGPWDIGCRFHNPDLKAKIFDAEKIKETYRKLVDYVLSRPDVDAERLIVTGESYGGGKTMVHAACDNRFAAVVPNSPIHNLVHLFKTNRLPAYTGSPEDSAKVVAGLPYLARVTLERVIWSHGFDSLVDWIPILENGFISDPSKINCAFLSMCAESESPELKRQAEFAYEHVSSKVKAIKKGLVEDGADLHVQVNNPALGQSMMFDWLDEVLNYQF